MILIALLFFILGHKIPLWITGQKMFDIRAKGGLRQIFFEMSGVLFVFLNALLILTIVGLSTKERYLLNENVIYGLNFSQSAKKLGFKNGDKIVSVNDKEVVEFNDILEDILFSYGEVRIGMTRENYDTAIILTDKDKFGLIREGTTPFIPRLNADTTFNPRNDLIYSERQRSFLKSLSFFPMTIKQVYRLFAPRKYKGIGGFPILKVTNLASFLHLISWNLIFIGFLNLLPIPGLDLGNTSIALIEAIRKRKFNFKRIKIVRYVCIGIISLLMIFIILYSKI
jgi:membrane-associated protease RseP (regulator of RpoE activity)